MNLNYERVDGLPVIIGMAKQLRIHDVINRCIPRHGNKKGLNYGSLTIGWLGFILSRGSHCKSHAESWARKLPQTLGALLAPTADDKDFSDDRLANLLEHFSDNDSWHAIENSLWGAMLDVIDMPLETIRLDSTTSYGYHAPLENGLMQLGFSKDDKPQLAQLKIMAGVEGTTGALIAHDTISGNMNDDILYLPLYKRIRKMLSKTGLIYCGDSKLSSLANRAYISFMNDFYLCPLQQLKVWEKEFSTWIQRIVKGNQTASLVWYKYKLIGGGYEFLRDLETLVEGQKVTWKERVIVFRSLQLVKTKIDGLEKRLKKAEKEIGELRRIKVSKKIVAEDALKAGIECILKKNDVEGLLKTNLTLVEIPATVQRAEIRKGKVRKGSYTVRHRYYEVSMVARDLDAIRQKHHMMGWRIYVTNASSTKLSLSSAMQFYRDGYRIESLFHFLKAHPINIQPIFVKTENQLIGLARLLTIALRLWTSIELKVRQAREDCKESIVGLYKGQPKKQNDSPSTSLIMDTFSNIDLWSDTIQNWYKSELSPNARLFLKYLGMDSLFENFVECVTKHNLK